MVNTHSAGARLRRYLIVAFAAISLLSISIPAIAASGSGGGEATQISTAAGLAELSGQVRDGLPLQGKHAKILVPTGLPAVAGATVSIPSLGLSTATNASGSFAFQGLRVSPGSAYTLVVRKKGLGRWQESGIKLSPGADAQVYVELHSAPLTLLVPRPALQPYNGNSMSATSIAPTATGGCGSNSSGWTSQTQAPPSIRVYLTGVHGSTNAGQVITYDFTFYQDHTLPNEWIPSWPESALEAGAVAVRDYAWYFVVHGSKGTSYGNPNPCSFDVDDSTDYQNFDPFAPTYSSTNDAVNTTSDYLYTNNSKIPETEYNSGYQGEACGNETVSGSMSQWGTQACASDGDSWKEILSIYYGYTLTRQGGQATGLPGSPALYDPASGNLEVYGVGSDNTLQEFYWNASSGWHGPKNLGGSIAGTPSAVYDIASGNLEVYARGTDETVQEIYWNPANGWSAWKSLGSQQITGSPSAVYNPLGKDLEVYAVGAPDSSGAKPLVEYYWNSNGWHGPENLGGSITGSPSAVYDPAGQSLEIYARGADGTVTEYYWNGSWHDPMSLGSQQVTGSPSAVYNPRNDDLEVYATSAPDSSGATPLAEYYWNSNGWHTGSPPTGSVTGSPAAVYNSEGETLEVYAAGEPDSNGDTPLVEYYWNGSNWLTGNPPSEMITARPAPVYDNEGDTFEVYTIDGSGSPLNEIWWDPNGWHGPQNHGGTLVEP
jgi:hypothetical protein